MSVYLDHAATTPMRDSAIDEMSRVARLHFGNPSGAHANAQAAREIVESCRDEVAELLGAEPREVIFTSGGTEGANLAVFGYAANINLGNSAVSGVVCSSFEHHAVLNACEQLGASVVGVTANGTVDLNDLAASLDDNTSVVSIMSVNNEVGTIQDVSSIVRLVRKLSPSAVVHTDAVQALNWLDVREHCRHADSLSVSAHKVGGPMGVGALVARVGAPRALRAQIVGGGQEREMRSGTQNVAGIAAMTIAMREAVLERSTTVSRVCKLRDSLLDGLLLACPSARETVPRAGVVGGHAHITFDDVDSDSLLFLLDDMGVFASAGASCASGAAQPSHVLLSLGFDEKHAKNGLRLTLGRTTTQQDIDTALEIIPRAVSQLQSRRKSLV